jgi:carbon-monoxide dehydrogenase small subunit
MVMSATSLAAQKPDLSEADVREQLDGNLCRCTGYHNIVKAVVQGAQAMKAAP